MSKQTKNKTSILRKLFPSGKLRISFIVLSGILIGMLLLGLRISNASSYLSDEPETCINCHIMKPEYSSWFHSSHRQWTNCNDCHVPHDNPIRKYWFKATDGLRHATVFTFRNEPQVIRLNDAGKVVVQENCLRCHLEQVGGVSASMVNGNNYMLGEGKLCWECHRDVPHSRVHSLASTPYGLTPNPYNVITKWKSNKKNEE